MASALVATLLAGSTLLAACGGASRYASPLAAAKALVHHGFACTNLVSLPTNLLAGDVAQAGKCQILKAPGRTSADLNVTGGIDVTFYVLKPNANPSAMADQLFHQDQAEAAYGSNWVAEGSAQVFLGLAKALGGSYPPDEQAVMAPT
ncbi:MAG: hypothetical protein ACRDY2_13730 [Acidimicrobiales bacterium]